MYAPELEGGNIMRKYNKVQSAYMSALAMVSTLKEQAQDIEQAYMRSHNITDENGLTPAHIWCIDDDETFNAVNIAIEKEVESLGIPEAESLLRQAEDAMIEYGLSIVPPKQREILHQAIYDRRIFKIRQQVIDLVMKLDAKTVPKAI
jgi:hypothetical protein